MARKSYTWAYEYFIGIDVSKLHLDFAIFQKSSFVEHYKVDNTSLQIADFVKKIKKDLRLNPSKTVFGMEQIGIYGNHLLQCLCSNKANIVLEDANHIKKTIGTTRGKNDKVDAKRIANYLITHRDTLKLWKPKRIVLDDLARLCSIRSRMIGVNKSLVTPLKEERNFISMAASETDVGLCTNTISALKQDIEKLERHIQQVWTADENLSRLMNLIMSVPGVGPTTALHILIATNEFKTINNPRKFACYCGVAPFEYSSGSSVKKLTRVSKISNRKLKTLLHTCALSARRFSPEIKAYYERKTKHEGKHRMCVMNAIRFKLIARIFACVNHNRHYQSTYGSPLADSQSHLPLINPKNIVSKFDPKET